MSKPDAADAAQKHRKWLAGISFLVVLLILLLLTWVLWRWLAGFSAEGLREYIRSFGAGGFFVLLGLQVAQVFIALIPGELLETAAGYIFGPVVGTLLCYIGVAIASALVFLLTRRLGKRFVEVFVAPDRINELKFLNTAQKRNRLIFILYLIPGTPKDLLTYIVGLTDIKLHEFLFISLIARFPSVISSTVGGQLLGDGDYLPAILLYAITGAVSLLGILGYNRFVRRRKKQETERA